MSVYDDVPAPNAGANAPALIVGNFGRCLRLCAPVLIALRVFSCEHFPEKNWHLPLHAANTTRENFDILYEHDVLLRKCDGLVVRLRLCAHSQDASLRMTAKKFKCTELKIESRNVNTKTAWFVLAANLFFFSVLSPLSGEEVLKEPPPICTPFELQKGLARAGFYRGPVDGIVGKKTLGAFRNFQKAQGFEENGICSAESWERLRPYFELSKNERARGAHKKDLPNELLQADGRLPTRKELKQKLVP